MSSCEKCWADAGGEPDRYRELLRDRTAKDVRCSAEEQAGPHALKCPACSRMTIHQYTGEPMCGCPRAEKGIPTMPVSNEVSP